jgi:NADH-quinone oxidoreductase subunit N
MIPELRLLLPETILSGGILLMLVADAARRPGLVTPLGMLAVLASIVTAALAPAGDLGQLMRLDGISLLARPAILTAVGMCLVARRGVRESDGAYAILLCGLGLGALVTAGASHLVTLWLGLEMLSLAAYPLAGWRGDRRSAEAGMKYILFGGIASAVMLFGMGHVYGLTGALSFTGIQAALPEADPALGAALAIAGAGLFAKLALVPLHFYAPDVYEGAPPLAVAAVATAPKVAVIAALAHVFLSAVPVGEAVSGTLTFLGVASVLWAGFTALGARDAQRILAYSAIGHSGLLVLALAALPAPSVLGALGYYLAAYVLATIGAFACLAVLVPDGAGLDRLAGAGRRRPVVMAALTACVLSLLGMPPLAGFLAKWNVLAELLRAGLGEAGRGHLTWAALTVLVGTALNAWAYLAILRAGILAPSEAVRERTRIAPGLAAVILICVLGTIALGLALGLAQRITAFLG